MIVKENNMNKQNIALVTGASSGIGEALTRELISKDWIVIGIARRIEKLNALKNEMGPSSSLLYAIFQTRLIFVKLAKIFWIKVFVPLFSF